MTAAGRSSTLGRRWRRSVLRWQGRLDGEVADRLLPWGCALVLFAVLVALDAAAIRSLDGGTGLAPWLQAGWRREHGWIGAPVAGIDPARGSWAWIAEPILLATRVVPAEALFVVVQAAAIAIAIVPLWRLCRDHAHLRVGATLTITTAYGLAPTLHRTNLTAFHPEVIALPALLWAYLEAREDHWWRYALCIAIVLSCRADLGLTVALLGLLLVSQGRTRPGIITTVAGLAWTGLALAVLRPELPDGALTPAGEFVARATTPLAVFPQLVAHPVIGARDLLAEPSVLFVVVVLAPLLFLPLISLRAFSVALACLVLAMIADQAVQEVAQEGVLTLAPAAAHVAPAMAFVFLALAFALERIGDLSVTRVNVDRRVLVALLVGASLFFVTEAPTSPYRHPVGWGSQDVTDGARLAAAERVDDDEAVAASTPVLMLVARRAMLEELPPDPGDLTGVRLRRLTREVDAIIIDTTGDDARTGEPIWRPVDRDRVLGVLADGGFEEVYVAQGIHLLRRAD